MSGYKSIALLLAKEQLPVSPRPSNDRCIGFKPPWGGQCRVHETPQGEDAAQGKTSFYMEFATKLAANLTLFNLTLTLQIALALKCVTGWAIKS